ncbi:AAA-ATPase-like domain-containing protein [Mycena kentingensis (nom. inval.)]|nr:AAA-ATPase-like domain-containing protein [Mycena kentingensis (nom. inval.)]
MSDTEDLYADDSGLYEAIEFEVDYKPLPWEVDPGSYLDNDDFSFVQMSDGKTYTNTTDAPETDSTTPVEVEGDGALEKGGSVASDSDEAEQEAPDFEPFLLVHNTVHACGGRVQTLPDPMDSFPDIATTPGVAFVFNPCGMDQLCRLLQQNRPIILRRPPGWGIEMFVTTFAARIERDCVVRFDSLFSDACTEDSLYGLHQNTVLMMDLRNVEGGTDPAHNLAVYVHERCRRYLDRYNFPPLLPLSDFLTDEHPAGSIVSCTVNTAAHTALPVLLVEHFDTLDGIVSTDVLTGFFGRLEALTRMNLLKGLVFFSDADDGTLGSNQERARNSFAGLQSAVDITHHPAFQTAVGYTSLDIWNLDGAFAKFMPDKNSEPLMEILHKNNVQRRMFHDPRQTEELQPTDPLVVAELRVQNEDLFSFSLEEVFEALASKYDLKITTDTAT